VVKSDKILARMRNNPRDWTMGDLKALAARHGVDWRQPGTSHVTFSSAKGGNVTVPAHKPIKSVYVQRFVAMLDGIGVSDGD
jgi:predicted RNA binding protein YcfA (HicA-like mRNA interferase family)